MMRTSLQLLYLFVIIPPVRNVHVMLKRKEKNVKREFRVHNIAKEKLNAI